MDDRDDSTDQLRMRLLAAAIEKRRLQLIVAYSRLPTLREHAIADLAAVVTEIKSLEAELEKYKDESTSCASPDESFRPRLSVQ